MFLSKHCMEVERVDPSNLPLTGPASGSGVDWQFQWCHLKTHHGIYAKAKLSWASSSQWPSTRVLVLKHFLLSVVSSDCGLGLHISKAKVVSELCWILRLFFLSPSSFHLPFYRCQACPESVDSPCLLLLQPLNPSQLLLQSALCIQSWVDDCFSEYLPWHARNK